MKPRVLVIEDDEQLRQTLGRLLTRAGYETIEAENGRSGMQQMSQSPADVVITDMIMPDMEGVETILAVRRNYPVAKIMAISGGGRSSAESYLKIARELGVHKILTKPLMPWEFLAAVHDLVTQKPASAE